MTTSDKIKVLFVQKLGEDEFETESIWCTRSGEYFVVDNIPFVAKRIAVGDIIKAEYDKDDKAFYFDDFVEVSGNSTLRVYFNSPDLISNTREALKELGCETEAFLTRNLIAVNVPKNVNYKPIADYLEEGEAQDDWQYEEACLAHKK